MNESIDYYKILGVKENAKDEEIIQACNQNISHIKINFYGNMIDYVREYIDNQNKAKTFLLDHKQRFEYDQERMKNRANTYLCHGVIEEDSNDSTGPNQKFISKYVYKWDYLKYWLAASDLSSRQKFARVSLVVIETFICKILISLVKSFVSLCNVLVLILMPTILIIFGGFFLIIAVYTLSALIYGIISFIDLGKLDLAIDTFLEQGKIYISMATDSFVFYFFIKMMIALYIASYGISLAEQPFLKKGIDFLINDLEPKLFKKIVLYE